MPDGGNTMKSKKFHADIGLFVPVSALRTKRSCGIGEFLDIIDLAQLCKKANISLIQILPVNDTGWDSSPYNLVSAFALNPCYIALERLPAAHAFLPRIRALRKKYDTHQRIAYQEVLTEKLKIARSIFEAQASVFEESLKNPESDEAQWLDDNGWIASYAVFKNIKEQNFQSAWYTWTNLRTPTKEELKIAWECPPLKKNYNFYIWLQYQLHCQLLEAVNACQKLGIMLKGDIPILLNRDSCDVWANHALFRIDITAGSPPDAENDKGQNWGFPCYFWQNHKEDGYRWWKERLRKIDQYFNAFRIDHVLGFFRIWAIPCGESTARLGTTVPYTTVSQVELKKLGFDDGRIHWMSEPHMSTQSIMNVNDNDYLNSHGELQKVADRIHEEELWVFKSEIKCEADLANRGLKPACEKLLREKWFDRMLIKLRQKTHGEELYTIAWDFKNTSAWHSLSDAEKHKFLELQKSQYKKSEEIWKKQGEEILRQLCSSVSMQAFAEDLGAVPPCVPEVLEKLNIFSLKLIRWERNWESPEKNFTPLSQYKAFSLTTPSTHDSSTLETWWNNELNHHERLDLLKALDISRTKIADESLTEDNAAIILKAIVKSPSKLVVFQIQDLLTLIADKLELEGDQRINTPGTVNDRNWTYRLPCGIETLRADKDFIAKLRSLKR